MHAYELFTTSDGSHTLLSSKFQVPYHSRHGAIGETQHVFIDAGFKSKLKQSTISILDIGLGTGLNTLMTLMENERIKASVYYEAIEAFPITIDVAKNINYPQLLSIDEKSFMQLHELEWNQDHKINSHFIFHKKQDRFEDFQTEHKFDVIYYDAFAPNAQPNLWEEEILGKMYALLNLDGVLVTYCAQGQFKRNLKAVGFSIEPLPGPVGKREMTRARKLVSF